MITLLIFLLITVIEFIIVYIKWNQVADVHEIGQAISNIAGIEEKYNSAIDTTILFLKKLEFLLWIFVPIILFLNLLLAFVFSILYSIISTLIHLYL